MKGYVLGHQLKIKESSYKHTFLMFPTQAQGNSCQRGDSRTKEPADFHI